MSEMNRTPNPQRRAPAAAPGGVATRQPAKRKKKKSGLAGRIIRRSLLMFFTILILVVVALVMILNQIFNGPSPAARDTLTMSLRGFRHQVGARPVPGRRAGGADPRQRGG